MKYVIVNQLVHNISDRAVYSDVNNIISIFFSMSGYRKAGVVDGENDIMLLSADENNIELEKIDIIDPEKKSELLEIREHWLYLWTLLFKKKCEREVKAVLDSASSTSRRQGKVNFKKEIIKRMEKSSKIFYNKRFEGYDFREINLSKAIFISCDLTNCNFSGVDMTDAVFINCIMKDILLYETTTNNSFVYSDCKVIELKELSKRKWQK